MNEDAKQLQSRRENLIAALEKTQDEEHIFNIISEMDGECIDQCLVKMGFDLDEVKAESKVMAELFRLDLTPSQMRMAIEEMNRQRRVKSQY